MHPECDYDQVESELPRQGQRDKNAVPRLLLLLLHNAVGPLLQISHGALVYDTR